VHDRSTPAVDGTSALAPGPAPDARRAALTLVRTTAARAGRPSYGPGCDVPTPPVGMLVRGVLEVLSGWRPAAQIAMRTSPEIAADLMSRPRRRSATQTPHVERLRVLRVADDAVEACAVLRRGRRCGALAMRLEYGSRGWLVTRLQVG
jgi:hypothetical protein